MRNWVGSIKRNFAVLGENDTYLSKAIVPRLLDNTFYFCGDKNRLVSTLFIKNLGPIVRKLIEIGPQNDSFNCSDCETRWSEIISIYSNELNIEVPRSKKSILSLILKLDDKEYALMLTFSYFGAHFPNDKLKNLLNINFEHSLKDGIKEAVKNFKLEE